MKLVILKMNEKSVCDEQDKVCDGLSCKKCQFNKYGVGTNYLQDQLTNVIKDYLLHNDKNDIYEKSKQISSLVVKFLIDEEVAQKLIGAKVFKKEIH